LWYSPPLLFIKRGEDMSAKITRKKGNKVTIEVTMNIGGSMLHAEEMIHYLYKNEVRPVSIT
jgi:hypothetical protein